MRCGKVGRVRRFRRRICGASHNTVNSITGKRAHWVRFGEGRSWYAGGSGGCSGQVFAGWNP